MAATWDQPRPHAPIPERLSASVICCENSILIGNRWVLNILMNVFPISPSLVFGDGHCPEIGAYCKSIQRRRIMPPSNSAAGIYPLHNLMAAAGEMSEACLKVANFIIDNPRLVSSMSIGELAKATESSQTMIVRVAKLSGYLGYRELRAALIEYTGAIRGANLIRVDPPRDPSKAETFSVLSREIVRVTIEALQDTLRISEERSMDRAVVAILRARRVLLVGFGRSAIVAQDACFQFLRVQIPSFYCPDADVLASIIAGSGPDDVLFCVCYFGTNRDIVEALKNARRRETPTILLTSMPRSPAAEASDITLVSAMRRAPRSGESVAVRVAQVVMMDIICEMVILKKGNETPSIQQWD